jgi:glucose/arabinose dehydrogenase
VLATPTAAEAAPIQGFSESTVFSGLTNPTVVRFASDGRVFVAEKRGVIKVFDSLTDTTPTVFADLNVNVYNFWDRGLLGMTLAPNFPADPYVYVLYTEDWCQQYPSHSVGTVEFGRDGALYASGGDGASFNFVDYGQDGSPLNPCGDPPGGVGATLTPPTAEGGALRSQDLRTTGDPVSLDGTVIRVDPTTGAARSDNPRAAATDPNERRIISQGFRNPFRFTQRPGTDELWVGDVGWNDWEEINVIKNDGVAVQNFGWPCYEGAGRQTGYDSANLNICENLYAQSGAVTAPYFSYHHTSRVVASETCPTGSSSIAGLDFQFAAERHGYPAEYDDALFFADYSRDCIWVMPKGADGKPAPGLVRTFVSGAANPVNLENGPGGDLFYVDFDGGTIRRVSYAAANQPPVAVADATPRTGSAPLTVQFDGTQSSDPEGGPLSYAWDLDGDGAFDDSTAATPTYTYTASTLRGLLLDAWVVEMMSCGESSGSGIGIA